MAHDYRGLVHPAGQAAFGTSSNAERKGRPKICEVIPFHLNTADHDKHDHLDHQNNANAMICGKSSSFFTVWQQNALAAIIGKNTNAGHLLTYSKSLIGAKLL